MKYSYNYIFYDDLMPTYPSVVAKDTASSREPRCLLNNLRKVSWLFQTGIKASLTKTSEHEESITVLEGKNVKADNMAKIYLYAPVLDMHRRLALLPMKDSAI